MTINEATRKYRLPNPTCPEDTSVELREAHQRFLAKQQ